MKFFCGKIYSEIKSCILHSVNTVNNPQFFICYLYLKESYMYIKVIMQRSIFQVEKHFSHIKLAKIFTNASNQIKPLLRILNQTS